jgi:hypothetical protein
VVHGDLELEELVLDVLARWDRRLVIANASPRSSDDAAVTLV